MIIEKRSKQSFEEIIADYLPTYDIDDENVKKTIQAFLEHPFDTDLNKIFLDLHEDENMISSSFDDALNETEKQINFYEVKDAIEKYKIKVALDYQEKIKIILDILSAYKEAIFNVNFTALNEMRDNRALLSEIQPLNLEIILNEEVLKNGTELLNSIALLDSITLDDIKKTLDLNTRPTNKKNLETVNKQIEADAASLLFENLIESIKYPPILQQLDLKVSFNAPLYKESEAVKKIDASIEQIKDAIKNSSIYDSFKPELTELSLFLTNLRNQISREVKKDFTLAAKKGHSFDTQPIVKLLKSEAFSHLPAAIDELIHEMNEMNIQLTESVSSSASTSEKKATTNALAMFNSCCAKDFPQNSKLENIMTMISHCLNSIKKKFSRENKNQTTENTTTASISQNPNTLLYHGSLKNVGKITQKVSTQLKKLSNEVRIEPEKMLREYFKKR